MTARSRRTRKDVEAAQAALAQPSKEFTPIAEQYPKTSTGRRLALARWMVNRDNPLTARVAINHLWMRHFGKPIVPTVVNFGLNGKPPSHPELLDWLAAELMEKNWSMKADSPPDGDQQHLSDAGRPPRMQTIASRTRDPENVFLWRMNSRRMEAETVRDSLLSVSGKLDTTMGGPEIEETQAEQTYRRSLYFHTTPDSQAMFLKLFNAPDPTDCYKREESIVPQQALALANSGLSRKPSPFGSEKDLSRIEGLVRQYSVSFVPLSRTHSDACQVKKNWRRAKASCGKRRTNFELQKPKGRTGPVQPPRRNQVCGLERTWCMYCLITMTL